MEYAPDLIADLAQQVTRVFKTVVERRLASSQTPITIANVETGLGELLREVGAQTLSLFEFWRGHACGRITVCMRRHVALSTATRGDGNERIWEDHVRASV